MKKINIILIMLAILGATSSYANCPAMDRIMVNNNNHYEALSMDGAWTDVNQTYGHKLPATTFWRAMGIHDHRDPEGVVSNFSCSYSTQDNYSFGLDAPSYFTRKYKIDLTSKNWRKEPSYTHKYKINLPSKNWGFPSDPDEDTEDDVYVCSYQNDVANCPFTLVQ